jgi:perosamine synthetase
MIPISKPLFGPEELEAMRAPLESGWVVQGPWVERFERKFAAFTASQFCAAASSCTTALHLAVSALKLGPGDEVIVPAFTWVSTANAIEYQGAKPVFCDIELASYNLDTGRLADLVTPRTVGILPVHLFGLCAEMDAVLELARRRALWVVEDAACAFGGFHRGRHAGSLGDLGAFSFHPRKSITTGEGGMVSTAVPQLDRLVRSLRDHGTGRFDDPDQPALGGALLSDYPRLGYNYRMTDLQGALGCAQMERAEFILGERARRARRYDELLGEAPWLRPPQVPEHLVHGYQAYVCLYAPEEPSMSNVQRLHERRNRLMQSLETKGIATRQGTHAPIALRYYAQKYGLAVESFENAWFADRLSLALPLYPQMTDVEQDRVVAALIEVGA